MTGLVSKALSFKKRILLNNVYTYGRKSVTTLKNNDVSGLRQNNVLTSAFLIYKTKTANAVRRQKKTSDFIHLRLPNFFHDSTK